MTIIEQTSAITNGKSRDLRDLRDMRGLRDLIAALVANGMFGKVRLFSLAAHAAGVSGWVMEE